MDQYGGVGDFRQFWYLSARLEKLDEERVENGPEVAEEHQEDVLQVGELHGACGGGPGAGGRVERRQRPLYRLRHLLSKTFRSPVTVHGVTDEGDLDKRSTR